MPTHPFAIFTFDEVQGQPLISLQNTSVQRKFDVMSGYTERDFETCRLKPG